MQRYLRSAFALALVFVWASAASAAQIHWLDTLEAGLKVAKTSQKPIMVESYTDT